MKNDRKLLTFNERGALSQILSIEEHLQQLPSGVDNSWCVQKHSLLCCDHHLAEAVNHASRIDPLLAERYRRIKIQAERVLKPSEPGVLPKLGEVARLRNSMRQAFGDPTAVSGKPCSICSKDNAGMKGGVRGLGADAKQPESPVGFVAVLLVGGFLAWLTL